MTDKRPRPRAFAVWAYHRARLAPRALSSSFFLGARAAQSGLMFSTSKFLGAWVAALLLAGCVTRSADVAPLPANPADFAAWGCDRIDDETDRVQQRAAEVAYSVDELSGNNIVALGVGLTVFWPALIAMKPPGPESDELARLKGRYEALRSAAQAKSCPPPEANLSAARAAALPVALGELFVYEQRVGAKGTTQELALRLVALRRAELEFVVETPRDGGAWRQDFAGNVTEAPGRSLQWPRLLRTDLELGQVLGGVMWMVDEPNARARVRGQVVAVGPQTVAGRRFDVAVVELFGEAQRDDRSTRLDGVIVVDRRSGVLLRLDLRSAQSGFDLQRRLARIEPPQP
jgi:hypothetical protein